MNRRLGWILATGAVVMLLEWAATRPPQREQRGAAELTVPVPEPSAALVTLAHDGALSLTLAGATDEPIGSLERVEVRERAETLARLRLRLERPAAGTTDEAGRSRSTLDVAVDSAAPWARALWILEVASSPSVGIHGVRLRLPDAPEPSVAQELAYGRGRTVLDAGQESVPVLWVRLREEDELAGGAGPRATRVSMAIVRVKRGEREDPPWDDDTLDWRSSWATYEGARRLAAEARRAARTCEAGVLDVPRPQRLRVTYGEAFAVLRALRDEGIARTWILHRSMALPAVLPDER